MFEDRDVKLGIDVAAGVGAAATFLDYAPKIVAVLAIVWYLIQIGTWAKTQWNMRRHKKRRKTDE